MDYNVLAEMGEIISFNNQDVVNDMILLAKGYDEFYEKYPKWCDEVIEDPEDEEEHDIIFLIFSTWLMGYKNEVGPYTCHFDWREETDVMVKHLMKIIQLYQLPLDLNDVQFSGMETTEETLSLISEYCRDNCYALVSLGTDWDSYYVFITTHNDYERLRELGKNIEFEFYLGAV